MAILAYNEVTPRKFILVDEEPFEVISSHVFRKQQRKPVNQTKLRNLRSGKVTERSFHQSETIPEADLTKKKAVFIYRAKGEAWFHDEGNPSERYQIAEATIGDGGRFLKEKTVVDALVFDDEVIGVTLPIKVELLVKEAAPAVKGNTAQGASKQVVLETGATIMTPLFINEGDLLRINTETGDYVERVNKV
jgi:elongation factor P